MQLVKDIAVKPFIKKYIAARHDVDPFVIGKTNKYGLFLYHCLSQPKLTLVKNNDPESEKRYRLPENIDPEIIDLARYSEVIKIGISENYWIKKGSIITSAKQLDFNKMVEYDFHDEFYKYVHMRIGKKGSINKAIYAFRESFSISEDELSFKTIQRSFQRAQVAITTYKSTG